MLGIVTSIQVCEDVVDTYLKAVFHVCQIPVPASTPANELKSVHKFVIQNGKTRVTSQVHCAKLSLVVSMFCILRDSIYL